MIDPFKDFTPRQNPTVPAPQEVFTPLDLTDDDLRKLSKTKLSIALQAIDPIKAPEQTRKLVAELLDRLDGKPAQAVTLDANIRNVTVNATIEFIRPIREGLIVDHVDNLQAIDKQ